MGIHCADHGTPSICKKLALTSPTSGGRSVGIVRLQTKTTGFIFEQYCLGEVFVEGGGKVKKYVHNMWGGGVDARDKCFSL
jgi:hypothetical protein